MITLKLIRKYEAVYYIQVINCSQKEKFTFIFNGKIPKLTLMDQNYYSVKNASIFVLIQMKIMKERKAC